jgi:hypothetical protein
MYKTGRVYKIITSESNEIYVGSTFNTTRDRFFGHKRQYNFYKNSEGNKCSLYDLFDNYGIGNCKMVLIKSYEVIDRRHLEVYETLWIKKLKAINKIEPCGGLLRKQQIKQYKIDNTQYFKEKNKQYYQNNLEKKKLYREINKEKIREKKKEYHEKNKEKLKEYNKQYHQNNLEKLSGKNKEYYQNNREYFKNYYQNNKEKTTCECGSVVTKHSLAKHRKTAKHIQLIFQLLPFC